MSPIEQKFAALGVDHAPGQEVGQQKALAPAQLRGEALPGCAVDFSHGDVGDRAFAPAPGALEQFVLGTLRGGSQAYTEYRGAADLRDELAQKLATFTGAPLAGGNDLIITPGTQGALFLAAAASITAGDRVAIVVPDYFANRKIVAFLGAQAVPVRLDYLGAQGRAGVDLAQLQGAIQSGVRTLIFSNPNNPTGVVYSPAEIAEIARLANQHGVTVIVDQLYSRLLYEGQQYSHLRASGMDPDQVVTIMGPSKTESLSGYRVGTAFGAPRVIERMEKLQAIVSLRAAGYCQAVLRAWFAEPQGWMQSRIDQHAAIRDELLGVLRGTAGVAVRTPEAGSYLFPHLPPLQLTTHQFVIALRQQAAVTVTAGTEFDPQSTNAIRLNFSQNHAASTGAVQRIAAMVDRYRQ